MRAHAIYANRCCANLPSVGSRSNGQAPAPGAGRGRENFRRSRKNFFARSPAYGRRREVVRASDRRKDGRTTSAAQALDRCASLVKKNELSKKIIQNSF